MDMVSTVSSGSTTNELLQQKHPILYFNNRSPFQTGSSIAFGWKNAAYFSQFQNSRWRLHTLVVKWNNYYEFSNKYHWYDNK